MAENRGFFGKGGEVYYPDKGLENREPGNEVGETTEKLKNMKGKNNKDKKDEDEIKYISPYSIEATIRKMKKNGGKLSEKEIENLPEVIKNHINLFDNLLDGYGLEKYRIDENRAKRRKLKSEEERKNKKFEITNEERERFLEALVRGASDVINEELAKQHIRDYFNHELDLVEMYYKDKGKTTKQTRDTQKIIEDMKYRSLFEETWKKIENKISEIQAYFENEKELPEKVEKEEKKKIIRKMAEIVYLNEKYESRGRAYKEKDEGYIEKAVRLLKEIFKKDKEEAPEIDKIEKEAYGFTEDEARELARKYGIDRIPHEGDTEINSIPQDEDNTPPQTIEPYPEKEPEKVPEHTCRMDERITQTYKEAYIRAINEVKEKCKKTGVMGKIMSKLKGKWSIDTKKLEKAIDSYKTVLEKETIPENVAELEAYLDVLKEVKGKRYVGKKYSELREKIEDWKGKYLKEDVEDLKDTTVLAYEPGILDKTNIYKALVAAGVLASLVDAAGRRDPTAPLRGFYNLMTGAAGPDKITAVTGLAGAGAFAERVYSGIRDFERGKKFGEKLEKAVNVVYRVLRGRGE